MNNRPRFQILVTGLLWGCISAASFYFHHPRRGGIFAGLSAFFVLSAAAMPGLAIGLHRVLNAVAQGISAVVTWTLLGCSFYLIVVPMGLVLRLTGALRTARHAKPALETYWTDRRQEPFSAARYLRPF